MQSFGRRREGGTTNSSDGFCLCSRPRQEQRRVAGERHTTMRAFICFQSGSGSRFGRAVGGSLAGGDAFAWSRIPSRNAAASSSLIQPSISTLLSYCARERSRDPSVCWPAEPPAWDAAGACQSAVGMRRQSVSISRTWQARARLGRWPSRGRLGGWRRCCRGRARRRRTACRLATSRRSTGVLE